MVAAWLGLESRLLGRLVVQWSRRPGETVKLSSTSDRCDRHLDAHFAPPELPEVPVGEFHWTPSDRAINPVRVVEFRSALYPLVPSFHEPQILLHNCLPGS